MQQNSSNQSLFLVKPSNGLSGAFLVPTGFQIFFLGHQCLQGCSDPQSIKKCESEVSRLCSVCVRARSVQDSFLWQASRYQQSDLSTKSETSNKTKSINCSSWRHTFPVRANNIHRNNHIQFDHV